MQPQEQLFLDEGLRARLTAIARRGIHRRAASRVDAEDIVQSVFVSLCLSRNKGLWTLPLEELKKILGHRAHIHALNRMEREESKGRDPGREERQVAGDIDNWQPPDHRELSPEDMATLRDFWSWLVDRLLPKEKQILELYMDGTPKLDIARIVGRGERTVNRTLEKVAELISAAFEMTGV